MENLIQLLKNHFGYDSFRNQQQAIIENVLQGNDSLVIMPTGGGKSICFQLPAIALPKTTIVISPLIALMKDQVDGLNANGISAMYFNSSQDNTIQNTIIHKISNNELKLLYVAPESLGLLSSILNEKYISCIAIDEAHCISSWGHDFRPSYQQLSFLKKSMPSIPVIALTATADKATRQDIIDQLAIPHAQQFISSFDRPNISLEVRTADKRAQQIIQFIEERPTESGIIYCLSRKSTEKLAETLKTNNIHAAAYHAGLSHAERAKTQEDFIYDKTKIICATIAFGMGIDKSNVRWVIHHNMPKNIEGYYQEIGRAGRDELPSTALLFHSYADVLQLKRFIDGSSNEEFQLAKLERMKQFAEANSCRRKVLLSYFGELLQKDCGNCDICQHPPTQIDGTIFAQKILSVIARLKENEPVSVVIDVLRASRNAYIINNGYDKIKSYGVGRDLAVLDWKQYIVQLVNQGFCEIAFHQKNTLKLTPLAKRVLFDGEKVAMTKAENYFEKKKSTKKEKEQKRNVKTTGLFERLRLLRHRISLEKNIPAYLVFNDATLKEMERERPMSHQEFISINGVGQQKAEDYAHVFIQEIIDFTQSKKKKIATHIQSFQLYKEGKTPDEIAKQRNLKIETIYTHLGKAYEEGSNMTLDKLISEEELKKIKEAKTILQNPDTLKPYFEYFEEKIPYYKIRIGLYLIEKS